MKFLKSFALALGFIVASCSATPAFAASMQVLDKFQTVFAGSVQLGGFCSGQIIYSKRDQKSGEVATYVLTAKHCVADTAVNTDIPVIVNKFDETLAPIGSSVFLATVKGKSSASDVALLQLADKDTYFASPVKLEAPDTKLKFGEGVYSFGFPIGYPVPTITAGFLGAGQKVTISEAGGNTYLRASAPIAPGNSGGGLYHEGTDGSLKLLGIATAAVNQAPWIALFTSYTDINAYLKVIIPEYYAK